MTTAQKKKEPVHKIFYLCSTYIPDEGWSAFLKDCSFGKFPKGIRFEDNAIKCNRGKQVFTEYLPKDAEKAASVIIQIFRDRLGIKTNREKKCLDVKFEKRRDETKIETWKNATTIAAKAAILHNFVGRLASYYCMTDSEYKEVIILLEIALATKVIDGNAIKMTNGKIIQIDGLVFDPYTRKIGLQANLPEQKVESQTHPIDFQPVHQTDYPKRYLALLDYHYGKQYQSITT